MGIISIHGTGSCRIFLQTNRNIQRNKGQKNKSKSQRGIKTPSIRFFFSLHFSNVPRTSTSSLIVFGFPSLNHHHHPVLVCLGLLTIRSRWVLHMILLGMLDSCTSLPVGSISNHTTKKVKMSRLHINHYDFLSTAGSIKTRIAKREACGY